MTGDDLVRAWKDPDHRDAGVDHPAGDILLGAEHVGASTTGYLPDTVQCTLRCTLHIQVCGEWTAPPYCAETFMLTCTPTQRCY